MLKKPRNVAIAACLALFMMAGAVMTFAGAAQAADEKAKDAGPILVFGHTSPDSDAVFSAMSAAYLWNARGIKAEAFVQGKLNPETEFLMKKFGLKTPPLLGAVAGKNIGITDFADTAQGPKDMKEASLVFIVDHHKLGDVSSASPLEVWMQPWGCACTILYEMYQYYGVTIPKDLAGGMMGAILSDTVIFKSVTTTKRDREVVEALAKIAGVADPVAVGLAQFNAKAEIDGVPAKDLVLRDYKKFDMSGTKVIVGQLEVVELGPVKARKAELLKAMEEVKKENGAHSVFLMLTDIMAEGTLLLTITDDASVVEKAWSKKLVDNAVDMPGVMSRKKQIIPQLEGVFSKK